MSTAAGSDTRDVLVRAAEHLMATQGIERASLREIARAAGQGNTGAIQYHFGDRQGLVLAILDKHRAHIEPRRHALLDQYEDAGVGDLRALAAALVLPAAAKLADPDGGRDYLRIASEHWSQPATLSDFAAAAPPKTSITRWHTLVAREMSYAGRSALSARFAAIRFTYTELARRGLAPPRADDRAFSSHVVDLAAALLSAHPSGQTLRLRADRRADEDGDDPFPPVEPIPAAAD